jgi:hypothetical protein
MTCPKWSGQSTEFPRAASPHHPRPTRPIVPREPVAIEPCPPEAQAAEQQRQVADEVTRDELSCGGCDAVRTDHPQPPRTHAEGLAAARPAGDGVGAGGQPAAQPQQDAEGAGGFEDVAFAVAGEVVAEIEQCGQQHPQREHRPQVVEQGEQAAENQCVGAGRG